MKYLTFAALLGTVMLAEQPAIRVFTQAQADAGKAAYERTCGQCHTFTLTGRKGGPSELPPVNSLPEHFQKFISKGIVAPFVGPVFLERWGGKSAGRLVQRFDDTAQDPYFKFEQMNDDVVVNITAYVLQMNGAKPGNAPLTRQSREIVNDLLR